MTLKDTVSRPVVGVPYTCAVATGRWTRLMVLRADHDGTHPDLHRLRQPSA